MNTEKKRKRIGLLLMEAFNLSFETGDIYEIGTLIEEAIRKLKLPFEKCECCGRPMSFFDYHLKQGICDECAKKISEEAEDV